MLSVVIPNEWLREQQPEVSDQKAYDKWFKNTETWKGYAEIGAGKVRDGESGGHRKIKWDGARFTFGDAV